MLPSLALLFSFGAGFGAVDDLADLICFRFVEDLVFRLADDDLAPFVLFSASC